MSAIFTPGPWAVGFSDGTGETYITAGDHPARTDLPVVIVSGAEDSYGSPQGVLNPANARLIASAPDLLEIVQTFDNYMFLAGEDAEQDSNNPIRALRWKAQQVIARAQGAGA